MRTLMNNDDNDEKKKEKGGGGALCTSNYWWMINLWKFRLSSKLLKEAFLILADITIFN